jgi:catalase
VREISSTFNDHWSQARLFYNSLLPVEEQFLINAIRFELAQLTSQIVKQNVLIQLNRISHSLAVRVSDVLALSAPEPDLTYYHDNSTAFVSVFRDSLPSIQGLSVGVLVSAGSNVSLAQAASIVKGFESSGAGVNVQVIAEKLVPGVDVTYSAADAALFDSLIVVGGAENLFKSNSDIGTKVKSTLYPEGRPARILVDGYRFGKPVGFLAGGKDIMKIVGLGAGEEGVYNRTDVEGLINDIEEGLKKIKVLGRFALDE